MKKRKVQEGLRILLGGFPISFELFQELRETYMNAYGADGFYIEMGTKYMTQLNQKELNSDRKAS
jgi:hypothetical protein